MAARRAHAHDAEPAAATRATARQRAPFGTKKKPTKPISPEIRARAEELLAGGATPAQVARRTPLSREQVTSVLRMFERRQDRQFAALVRTGLVSAPDLPREPLPDPVEIEGGLSATVLSERR